MMKKVLMTCVALVVIAAAISPVRAQDSTATFSYSDYQGQGTQSTGSEYTMTKTGVPVSITETKFYGTGSEVRFYANGVTTVTPAEGVTIKQVVISATSVNHNGYENNGTITASTGSIGANGTIVTWTGNATEAFTLSHTKQIRWSTITVTYEEATQQGGGSQGGASTEPQEYTLDSIPTTWMVKIGDATPVSPTAYEEGNTQKGYATILERASVELIPSAADKNLIKSIELTKQVSLATPLTLEALTAGTIVVQNPQSGMQYSLNGGAKTAVTADAISVAAGDKVAFYGDGTNITSYQGTTITGSGEGFTCKAYGNIMSLLDEQNFATATTLTGNHAFYQLFLNNLTLTDASGLLLPATALTNSCYNMMFYNCSALTAAPALPATTMADKCYQNMFYGCTALTTAPALPATTLAEDCYNSMFQSSGLTAAPALPATTLAVRCYNAMFRSCDNLATAPSLPATVLPDGCYMHMFRESGLTTVPANMMASATTMGSHSCESMFRECPNLTNAPTIAATTVGEYSLNAMFYHSANVATAPASLPATTLAPYCYYNMFNGCTALTMAPALPATTLAEHCYENMFKVCSNLSTVACLATDISADGCTSTWLQGAGTNATTKTFTTPSTTTWSNNESGIPSGWTRVNADN